MYVLKDVQHGPIGVAGVGLHTEQLLLVVVVLGHVKGMLTVFTCGVRQPFHLA